VLLALVTGLIGGAIGWPKGRPVWGFFLGLLLSVLGLVIIALSKPSDEALTRRAMERQRIDAEAARRLDAERQPGA